MLALDASSSTIGWSLWQCHQTPYAPLCGGTLTLDGKDLALRLAACYGAFPDLLRTLPVVPDVLAIEGSAFASTGRDEQQQMMGVIKLAVYQGTGITGKRLVKVPPNSAKLALSGYGLADKEAVGRFAAAWIAGADEHAADSVAVAIGALERLGLIQAGDGFVAAHAAISDTRART
jgi:Holliday junction resolvasome RuvABC endonuclease subunit